MRNTMKKYILTLALVVLLAGCGGSSVYFDKNDAGFSQTEYNKLDTQAGILELKTFNTSRLYKENRNSLKIVYGMSNQLGDFKKSGAVVDNYFKGKSGFTKTYDRVSDKLYLSAWNKGQKIVAGIGSEALLSGYNEELNSLGSNIITKKDIKVLYENFEVPYKMLKAKSSNGYTYEYWTAYNSSIMQAKFVFVNVLKADKYTEDTLRHITLKILVDTGKISQEQFSALKNDVTAFSVKQ